MQKPEHLCIFVVFHCITIIITYCEYYYYYCLVVARQIQTVRLLFVIFLLGEMSSYALDGNLVTCAKFGDTTDNIQEFAFCLLSVKSS